MEILGETLATVFFWTLKASGQASVLILLVLMVKGILGRVLTPAWQYALWLLVVAKLLLPFTPQSAWSVFNVSQWWDPEVSRAWPWVPMLGGVWFLGVMVSFGQVLRSSRKLGRELVQEHAVVNPEVSAVLVESQKQLGVRRILPVVQSGAVGSPALMGFIRPWILLPEGLMKKFTSRELHYIFLHELAHLKRRDILVNWLMTAAQVLHWFNPLVWLASSRMRGDRELACDAHALKPVSELDRRAYGQTMLKLLDGFTPQVPMGDSVGILETPNLIKQRIMMIKRTPKRPTPRWPGPLLLLAIGLVTLTDAQQSRVSVTTSTPSKAKPLALRKVDHPKGMWFLSGDVFADEAKILGYRDMSQEPMVLDFRSGEVRHYAERLGGVVLSPDGQQIAGYTRNDNKFLIAVLDIASGEMETIYETPNGDSWVGTHDWSPNGESILINRTSKKGVSQLMWLSVADGALSEVFSIGRKETSGESDDKWIDPKDTITRAKSSPDGKWIALELNRGGDLQLVAAAGGDPRPVVTHSARDRLLDWLPSGEGIIFASDRGGDWSIYGRRIEDGEPRGEDILLKQHVGHFKDALGVTDDGTFYFAIEGISKDFYVADFDSETGKVTGEPEKAGRVEGRNSGGAWSPDGKQVAYIEITDPFPGHGTLCVQDWETRKVKEVVSDGSKFYFASWFSDQRHLYAGSFQRGGVYRVHIDSGKAQHLLKRLSNGYEVVSDAWKASDPKEVEWYFPQWEATKITKYGLGNGVMEEFIVPWSQHTARVSPDQKSVVYSVTSRLNGTLLRQIFVVRLSGGKPRELIRLTGNEAIEAFVETTDNGLGWSHDGEYVFFVKGKGENSALPSLWRVPAKGGEAESLGVAMEGLHGPGMSPDGRRLCFNAGWSGHEVWALEGLSLAE